MSETGGTEATGFPADQPHDAAAAPVAGPREFTAEELDQARQLLAAQGETFAPVTAAPAADQSELGMQALADGAQADEIDPAELLRSIQALQAQVSRLEAEKRTAQAPDVVKYADAIAGHLQALADANPVIHADPDHTLMPMLEHAAAAVNAAHDAADSGDPAPVHDQLDQLDRLVARHQRRFPGLHFGYVRDLLDEARDSAHKLAA